MSLNRLIYYSAIVGGWSAFFGWLAAELLLNRGRSDGGLVSVALTCALVGAAIGAGLNLLAGAVSGKLTAQLARVVPGLIAGGIGGGVGGMLGNYLYIAAQSVHVSAFGLPRAVGWMIMGAGIGVVEGLYEQSSAKLRNGLIGGAVGGLIGGALFDPIVRVIASSSGMSSRATAFVILGLFIGMLIGLVKVVFREAWLTVLDGYRPGRQLILANPTTVLGRAEYAGLPFTGKADTVLDMEHARVVRTTAGRFALEDNHSRQGTFVNNQRIGGTVTLNDGDVIKLGSNSIRFSERHRHGPGGPAPAATPSPATTMPVYKPTTPLPAAPQPQPQPQRPVPPPLAPGAPVARPYTPASQPPPKHQPQPQPQARPAPSPSPSPAPTPAAPSGVPVCPGCKKPVPAGQRYCIRCDLYF